MDPHNTLSTARTSLCIYPWRKGISATNWLPPLGLECISAAIKQAGVDTHLVDMRFEPDPEHLRQLKAEAICISANWEDQLPMLPFLTDLFNPDQAIIVGGRAASLSTEEIFKTCPNVDAVVRGDGEETRGELFSGIQLETISGLSRNRSKNARARSGGAHRPGRQRRPRSSDIPRR